MKILLYPPLSVLNKNKLYFNINFISPLFLFKIVAFVLGGGKVVLQPQYHKRKASELRKGHKAGTNHILIDRSQHYRNSPTENETRHLPNWDHTRKELLSDSRALVVVFSSDAVLEGSSEDHSSI